MKWDFLDQALERKSLSTRWRLWMGGCLSSTNFVVSMNGSAKGWFKATRGLRQGNPLSSFLSTVAVDVFSRMMLGVERSGLLEGFLVGRSRVRVTYLCFVDDNIFSSRVGMEDLQNFKLILLVFGCISGLKINLDKSTLFGINMS